MVRIITLEYDWNWNDYEEKNAVANWQNNCSEFFGVVHSVNHGVATRSDEIIALSSIKIQVSVEVRHHQSKAKAMNVIPRSHH